MNKIKPIILPKDNGPHNFTIEWWYFNGHLKGEDSKKYSFMNCLFKVDIAKVNIPNVSSNLLKYVFDKKYIYFAHSVLVDMSNLKSYKEIQDISIISKDSFKKDLLFVNYKDAFNLFNKVNNEIIEIKPNNFYIKNKNLNLSLESTKKPMLEGGKGYIGTPKSGSYYYSFTDMKADGNVIINNKNIKVSGKAWMDHQWANAVYKKDKWTWFSFQLDNGTEIMLVEYCKEGESAILVDILDKNAKQKQYSEAVLKSQNDFYKSRKTKTQYPLSWSIDIPKAGISIKTKALSKKQEIIFGQINYWEGAINVEAIIDGKKIKGLGFMELVGYPSDYNYLLLEGEKIKKEIFNLTKKIFTKK